MQIRNIIDRIGLFFADEKELRRSLYDIMGFYPHSIEHYKLALMHKSSGKRNEKGRPLNNERLEFLGDAMLDAVVGHIVYHHFPGKREGFLTNTRSKLVSRDTLGKLAQEMGLTDLIMSSGTIRSHNSYMAGNAFEALVGAIYLDQGYSAVMQFVQKRILKQLINIDKVAYKEVNFKSKLIEWTQKNRVKLDYRMLKQEQDQNGSPMFSYQVFIEDVEGGIGKGFSKKESQQRASKETLQRLRREPQFIDAIFASKSERTKMEEEPTAVAPDLEAEQQDFIIEQEKPKTAPDNERKNKPKPTAGTKQADKHPQKPDTDDFDLSDISAKPKEANREDIIAAAEAAAYSAQ